MILFVLFLSLYIGINFRTIYILGIIESVAVIAFCFYRFHKKVGVTATITLLIGIGLSFIRPTYNKSSYQSLVIEVRENYYIASSGLERLYVYEKNHSHEIGDILLLEGEKKSLDFSMTESSFDFASYLNKKGVYSELSISKTQIKFSNPIKINKLRKDFLSHFDNDTKAMIGSLIFGISENEETISNFRNLHLSRLISNSGLYLNIVFIICSLLFRKLNRKYMTLGGLTLFAIYSIFAFPRFVVLKFLVIHLFKWVNEYLLKKRFTYLEVISLSGIFFLLLDYHYAYQDSFFLSFYIPILILFFNGSFGFIHKKIRPLFIPLVVSIAFVPFAINYYYEISPLSPVIQILLMPLMILYMLLGLISFIGIPIYPLLNGYTSALNSIVNFVKPICFKIYVSPGGTPLLVIYEVVFLILLFFISIRFIDLIKFILACLTPFSVFLIPLKPLVFSFVSFINVGQGDSCLIQYQNTVVMIDTGGLTYKDLATESLIPYLKKEQIYDIDLLITTHDDYDHYGAASSLISNFKVKSYIKDYSYFPISIGDITLYNLNTYTDLWQEENDESLVIYFTLKNSSFLITGDAPKKIESKIVSDYPELRTDILKVGHHGSNTSSSDAFIKQLEAKEAVISCGKNNKYGHPNKEVLSTLYKYKIKIRRTDLEGTIKYRL